MKKGKLNLPYWFVDKFKFPRIQVLSQLDQGINDNKSKAVFVKFKSYLKTSETYQNYISF